MILTFVMRHSLSAVGLVNLLELINEIFGKAVLMASKFLFEKVFKNPTMNLSFNFCCSHCFKSVTTFKNGGSNENEKLPCPGCYRECNVQKLNEDNFFITVGLQADTPGT